MRPESFAPYGELLLPDALETANYGDADSKGWRHRVHLEGSPELVTVRTPFLGLRFERLERHLHVGQAFVPIAGVTAAVAVARSALDPSDPPRPDDVRAFAVEPGVGYLLDRDTWHSLDRYPLTPGHIDVVMMTAVETTDEAATRPKSGWRLTQETDYVASAGTVFELVVGARD